VPQVQCTWTEDPALGDQRRSAAGDATSDLAFAEAAGAGAGAGGGHGGGRSTGRRKSIAGATELEEVRRRLSLCRRGGSRRRVRGGRGGSPGLGRMASVGLPQVHHCGTAGVGTGVGGGEGVGGVPVVCQVGGRWGEGFAAPVAESGGGSHVPLRLGLPPGGARGRGAPAGGAPGGGLRPAPGLLGVVAQWHTGQGRDACVRECAQGKGEKGGEGGKKEKKGKKKSTKGGAGKSSKQGAQAGEGEGRRAQGEGEGRRGTETGGTGGPQQAEK